MRDGRGKADKPGVSDKRWLRRAVQLAVLALFLVVLVNASAPMRFLVPVDFFLDLSPLNALIAGIAGRALFNGWWLALIVDHFSRRVMGSAVFPKQPTQQEVQRFLERTFAEHDVRPKYLVTDQGVQFSKRSHTAWCKRHGVKPRFGAIGQHGSLAVIERAILTGSCCSAK